MIAGQKKTVTLVYLTMLNRCGRIGTTKKLPLLALNSKVGFGLENIINTSLHASCVISSEKQNMALNPLLSFEYH